MMLIKMDNMIFFFLFLDLAFMLTSVRSTGFDDREDPALSHTTHLPSQSLQFDTTRYQDPTTDPVSKTSLVEGLTTTTQQMYTSQNKRLIRSRKNKRHHLSFYIQPRNASSRSKLHQNSLQVNESRSYGNIKSDKGFRLPVEHTTYPETNTPYEENLGFSRSPKKNNDTRLTNRWKRGDRIVSGKDEFTKLQPLLTQASADDISDSSSGRDTKGIRSAPGMPYFDPKSPKEIKVAIGSTAHIPCMARNIGTKPVSWIRNRDLHVLTVGAFSFTTDERFSAHRDTITKDWVLIVQHTDTEDSGLYECSVPTKPVTSHTVELRVLVPRTELVGTAEVHLERGSSLNLTCLVHDSPSPPEFILWYHRDKLVNYGSSSGQISSGSSSSPEVRDRVTVQTSHQSDTSRSSLLVKNATSRDSGRYHCQPSNAPRAVALVHVIPSEDPAAMQTTNTSARKPSLNALLLLVCFVMILASACNFVNHPQVLGREPSPEKKRASCLRRRCQLKSGQINFAPTRDAPFKPEFNSSSEKSVWMALRLCVLKSGVRGIEGVLMYLECICEPLCYTANRFEAKANEGEEELKPLLPIPIRAFTECRSTMTDLMDTVR